MLSWYLRRHIARPAPTSWGDGWAALRQAGRIGAPILVGCALLKLDYLVLVHFASTLQDGDVFLLAVAVMLVNVPMSVATSAVGQTVVPSLVRSATAGDAREFNRTYLKTAEFTLLLTVPWAVLLTADAAGWVEVLFRRGRFTEEAVGRTAACSACWPPRPGSSCWRCSPRTR